MTQRLEATSELTPGGRLYLGVIIAGGFAVTLTALYQVRSEPLGYQWYMLVGLALLSGSATIKLPSVPASISVSETFVFTAVLLFGPAAGTITVVLEGLVISFWMARRHPEWYRPYFNMSAPAISCWCASKLLFAAANVQPLVHQAVTLNVLLWPLAVFALVYFGLNSWLIAFAVAFETRLSPFEIWRKNLLWLSLNYFSAASVALLLVVYTRDLDLRFLGAVVPLILGFYFLFKTSMARVEDANDHLAQLNRLYLSTIETLAMAIDAKDQITHGHIRRVQTLAVGLAAEVGIKDGALIKAIEAAALLHDMGKLAVPEYILNKPGRLTAAEFEKMKLHATVGADILSAIDFPYPVVPIVRHHHENWDGTGYPGRLHATEIPIGARILSVVDCFDALTSDRPYRPRLSNEEALKILNERRGSMYDPLIVDTFVRVYERITPESAFSGPPRHALNEITSSIQGPLLSTSTSLEDIAAGADEMLTLYELASALAGQASVGDTGDIIAKHLRRLVPSSLCVFYLYDAERDELEASHAVGDAASDIRGLRIQLGHRLSGWVAANRQTIFNSDATLDLGEVARRVTPRLRSCLSTPLLWNDSLVGVLSLYSTIQDSFTDDHRRVVEIVARQISHTFKSAIEFDQGSTRRDPITGLPDLRQLQHVVSAPSPDGSAHTSVLLIDVVGLESINMHHGRHVGDDVLRHVVRNVRAALRVADILFRCGSDEFAALLNNTDRATALSVTARIRHNIREHPFGVRGALVPVAVTVTCVSAPDDGRSLRDLISAARVRSQPSGGQSVH
ncbi:MAG: HD domain-containing phosphohydrolase [Betaproteobacteria bacterium]